MIIPVQFSSLPVTPWKNGGGETREIVSLPSPDAPFIWRASIATLSNDGPFSLFPEVDRVITLLEGQPLWLHGDNIAQRLELWQPWAFAGEWPLVSEGISGRGLDFNIMTQRSRAAAQVTVVAAQQQPGAEGIAWVLQGRWQLAGKTCTAGSGIWWHGESPGELLPQSADARLLLAEIERR
ncbi:HutD family protein [Klebsiella sp. RHBSTW-00484]|uniref:HutD/Ves family protein n=1 Tax=unclassified Klebsiella TaxID=2608929 RepID=UPI0015E50047|nr:MULTISPECIES: HutD family protein [unclassified Klebsiella]MBA7846820.1 HutD family protein [Klebsiella sp. RHBSTW-00465]QLO37262.1 HutD family protein [Klebsiella sp. RHBSTW-00484]QLT76780.1 HutD family protein [Klebsiella sp. RHBSTW-00464]